MIMMLWIIAITTSVVLIGWLGLRIKPAAFAPVSLPDLGTQTVPLPHDLPTPVDRFFRETYGDVVPVIETAVISGRATMRIMGITFPARYRFIHETGRGYRHYIETTLFGLPLMKVNEQFLDGNGRMELPFGVIEDEPKVNQGANLALWGEAIWFPTLWVTDPRVRWEAVDDHTALLFVPFEGEQEQFVVHFDARTGRPRLLEAMRYKGAQSEQKTLWLSEASGWGDVSGKPTFSVAAVTWHDEGTPWAVFAVEEVVYNVDVSEDVRGRFDAS
jgi:uncharacterized protein DUF6544